MLASKPDDEWVEKARALDRYRWALLRERHGPLESVLRFARDALSDWWFGVRAKRRLASQVEAEHWDFLLLQSAPKVIAFRRKARFMEALREQGHQLIETALPALSTLLGERQLQRPPNAVPTRYFGYAAHAQWIVSRYRPSIVLNDRNGSLYTPFLRLALRRQQGLLVHLAHATTVETSRRLGMNDYDYYFLFGQSSFEALKARTLRFGTSRVVLAGSHMIDATYDLPAPVWSMDRVLILGVGPDKEKEAGYQATYQLLRNWAHRHPQRSIVVKAHPRSQVPFWHDAAKHLPNLHVLAPECTLAEALGQAGMVVNIMSNAVVEAALARRPILFVNCSNDDDLFRQESFFGPRIRTLNELDGAIADLSARHAEAIEASGQFADFHLKQGVMGLQQNVNFLQRLLRREAIPCQELAGTVLGSAYLP